MPASFTGSKHQAGRRNKLPIVWRNIRFGTIEKTACSRINARSTPAADGIAADAPLVANTHSHLMHNHHARETDRQHDKGFYRGVLLFGKCQILVVIRPDGHHQPTATAQLIIQRIRHRV